MIARLLSLIVRVLLETAMILLVIAALLGLLAFRVGRRTVLQSPDGRLEKLSGPLTQILRAFPRENAAAGPEEG